MQKLPSDMASLTGSFDYCQLLKREEFRIQSFSTFNSIWLATFHLTKGKITISCFCLRILILFLSIWALKSSFIPKNYLFLTVFEQCEELFTETVCTVLVWHITEGHYFQRFLINKSFYITVCTILLLAFQGSNNKFANFISSYQFISVSMDLYVSILYVKLKDEQKHFTENLWVHELLGWLEVWTSPSLPLFSDSTSRFGKPDAVYCSS